MTTKEMEYGQDDKTVILNRKGDAPAHSPLTDFAAPPKFEQLEERMIYAARLRPAESFNISLNPLVAAAASLGVARLVELHGLQVLQDLAGPSEHLGRQAGQLGHLDAVAAVGPAGHNVVQKRHFLPVMCNHCDDAPCMKARKAAR